jgi:hypothetical protein
MIGKLMCQERKGRCEVSEEVFAEGHTPPSGARTEARRGLEWRREYNRGGTAVGVARARDIANGKALSNSTVKRMVSYFARHEVDKKGQGWSPGQDGYPSAGRIAWALWGGDAGRSWANKVARQIDSANTDNGQNTFDQANLPDAYRPATSEDVPEGRACGNCMFYDESDVVQKDDGSTEVWCSFWDAYVAGDFYCDKWQPMSDSEEANYSEPIGNTEFPYDRKKRKKRNYAMRETFGSMPSTKPKGALRQVVFPELALMGVRTGDGRLLEEEGRGVRDLPRTIYGQFVSEAGHAGAVPIGALHEVTFEDGVASGRGWLIDDENGRRAVQYIETQTLFHNSVDLADVRAQMELSENEEDMTMRFTQWKIAATTLVGKPAFANAKAELIADEEIVASWYQDDTPLVIDLPTSVQVDVVEREELVADSDPLPSWDDFHIPESKNPQKIIVDENNRVSGHLALWNTCHDGIASKCTIVPRPKDNYASFNKPGVLTDRGMVETGPIFLSGGHRRAKNGDYVSAYGGIENAWADVRVTAGVNGPWISGIVRPGVEDAKVYAARASRISGHWIGDRLKAIVSVNAEGFDVPGSGMSNGVEFEFATNEDGEIAELVASFPSCFIDDELFDEIVQHNVEAAKLLLALEIDDLDD